MHNFYNYFVLLQNLHLTFSKYAPKSIMTLSFLITAYCVLISYVLIKIQPFFI